jgi:DNA topoisomerase-1
MSKNLVIVESPAKAKTIENYLGKDFIVTSSFGHVRDLPKSNDAIDVENNFKPTYVVSKDKEDVIRSLRKLAKGVETVWLATDDDREGEAISWHLKEALNLDEKNIKRIIFREITKTAILKAIENPRTIDNDLVNAQQARRILDRLVGFELSPVLWKKVKYGLSAGRVQSAAVRVVVEREREVDEFNSKGFYKVDAIFDVENGKKLNAELTKRLDEKTKAQQFLESCVAATFKIDDLEKKPAKKSPAAPFTTSTLQQEASRKLGFSVSQTMMVAQRLYEAGHISYMRTDSVNLSEASRQNAATEIVSSYGKEYAKNRVYKTKSASAQEAHEAIKPTDFSNRQPVSDNQQQRLYDLIWKRAIASQMSDARLERTIVTIGITKEGKKLNDNLKATGEIITFEGFLKVYLESKDDEDDDDENSETKGVLPPLKVGQDLDLEKMTATERFTRPKARYTEASLVKELEELGIGRPSTYAPTISTIQKREYVVKEARDGVQREYSVLTLKNNKITNQTKTETTGAEKNKLFPTNMGVVVNDFLVGNFPNVVDLTFTAQVEAEFDKIADGTLQWEKMLGSFYKEFHPQVVKVGEDGEYASTARELGKDPKTGRVIQTRMGRYGALVEKLPVDPEDKEQKAEFASLLKGQYLDKITLEEALELFKLPRDVGMFEDKKVVAAIGRFGPYIRHDSKFVSIPKEEDPLSITEERAIELIKDKRETDAKKIIKLFPENEEVRVLNGRWGAYIAVGKQNVKIPKDLEIEPADLTLEKCLELAESAPAPKGRFAKKGVKAETTTKKAPAKKATAKKATTKKPAAKKAAIKKPTTAKKTTAKKPAAGKKTN